MRLVATISGADFLAETGMTGPTIFFAFILICAVINLSLGSASAQRAVTVLIFVPILAWTTRYDKNLGVGTLIAMMLPYSMFLIAFWPVFFYL